MSDFYNEHLIKLAKRSNAEQMDSTSSFVQGFIMGRKYEQEFNSQRYNRILQEMRNNDDIKFSENNYWDEKISQLEKENFELKSKYVWENE